jgi:prepilin-type N-terminal cleavage/methylation domain-containing protein
MTKTIDRGMTLIEITIALAVLAFGLSAAFATVGYASRFQSTAAHVEEASALAQSLLSGLLSVPYASVGLGNASGSGPPQNVGLFRDFSTANNGDIADSAGNFALATIPAGSFDHQDNEMGPSLAAAVIPLPTGRTRYERYWNVAPLAVGQGVAIAVIVRWSEGGTYRRTVVVGTRYQP